MIEILDIISDLREDQLRDLMIILSLKYPEEFKAANRYFYWPNSIKEASEFVQDYVAKMKNGS
jgi:hypothetical protein